MSQTSLQHVAPTYWLTNIPEFVESITYRMLADGMLLQDIRAASEQVTDWAGWGPFWLDRARQHEKVGARMLAKGYRLSAGEHFVRASLCAHYGQFLYFAFPETKRELVELKAAVYRRATPLLDPPAEPFEVAFGGTSLPGYLRVPRASTPPPVVVHVNGLDAAKEDAHQFAGLCLARGLAVCVFDGPGQGEALYRGLRLGPDYHQAVSAVIDFLETRAEIDAQRVGVIGRSTGGFLAPQAAALDQRIKACVAWGAMYDLAEFDAGPPLIKDGFQLVTGSRNWDEAREAMRFVDLSPFADRISCPLYVLHGGKDNITPPYNAERMIASVKGPTELAFYPDSIHCNHDVAYIARPEMADWLALQLASP
jgi:2,6-dihydroxypseudooxynicotine hydrolase